MCYHLSKRVCPSDQQRAVPQAHSGEFGATVTRTKLLGQEAIHTFLPGWTRGGQVFVNHLKGRREGLPSEEEHGLMEMTCIRECIALMNWDAHSPSRWAADRNAFPVFLSGFCLPVRNYFPCFCLRDENAVGQTCPLGPLVACLWCIVHCLLHPPYQRMEIYSFSPKHHICY